MDCEEPATATLVAKEIAELKAYKTKRGAQNWLDGQMAIQEGR